MERTSQAPLVTMDAEHIELLTPSGYMYPIELSRISSPQQLIGWILHLSDKTWFTADHLRMLILLATKRQGWSPYTI